MKQALKIVFVSALATAALIKGVPALAEPAPAERIVEVIHTGDLDLASKAGQRQLKQRLVVAAHAVCDTASDVDLKARNAERDCRERVLRDGLAKASVIAARKAGATIVIAAQ
jgi:UrcA family protein